MINKSKILLLLLLVVLAVAPYWIRFELGVSGERLAPPGAAHWFGTDRMGRDVGARTAAGLLFSLGRAVVVLIGALAVGLPVAVLSVRTFGGAIDRTIAFLAETIRSLPFLALLLLCLTLKLPGLPVFLLYYWIPVWRLSRGAMAPQRNSPYVLSASLFGFSRTRVIITELLPNAWPGIYNNLPSLLADILAVLAALEFLGIGSEIGRPSLGGMLLDSVQLGFAAPWSWLPSLIMLMVFIWGLTLVSHLLQRRQAWTPLG
jgi:peptide/nickel transport system permease protein